MKTAGLFLQTTTRNGSRGYAARSMSGMSESISFDRAADVYDATRALPPTVAAAVTQALLTEIRGAGADRVLEVGIGTGRMARPLMAEGMRVTGVDISREMIGRLRAQLSPQHTQPDLVFGDATRLPLKDASFRAALIVHVLHLVASVDDTLAEIRRVLAPGGVLLHQTRRAAPGTQRLWDDSEAEWKRLLAARNFTRRPRADQPEAREMLAANGATLRLRDVAVFSEKWTADEEMDRLRNRQGSWTWEIPNHIFDDALPEYERWLRAQSPAQTYTDDVTHELEIWTWG